MSEASFVRVRQSLAAVIVAALTVPLLPAPAAHAAATGVRINEVESSGGSPGDWVELTNTGTTAVSLAGWVVKDNDDAHQYVIGGGVSLAPGAYLAVDVESAFGLGSADSVRLYESGGTLADSYTWSSHASSTYGRCPNGTGSFVTTSAATKGTANACPPPPPAAWPGGSAVANADASNAFGENLSGLSYESASVVWAVRNGAGTLYRLTPNGTTWQKAATYTLRYANGSGDPDAEGVVVTPDGIMVVTERDNSKSEYEPSTGRLWAACDDTCSGRSTTLTINAQGTFTPTATYNRPSGMSNYNNEGLAFSPACSAGTKQVLWADDSNDNGHALRSGTLSC
ncbi:lamin tail domain-containing protein [Dactylosporangium sp. NPDC049742]|uniref:lamin tail domain-containing protein n=1 Tax=Dactylosporangium sp. NPDC049742 TaxID=3154737 RepID=UPI003428715D